MVHHIKDNTILMLTQKTELIRYRICIHRELARFQVIQNIFMPAALPYLTTADQSITPPAGYSKQKWDDGPETVDDNISDKPPLIELQCLFLPSDLPPNI